MLIHIGNEFLVEHDCVIGVFDIDNCSVGKKTRKYFSSEQGYKRIIATPSELPRSFIVTKSNTLISGLSSTTIIQRIINDRNFKDNEYISLKTDAWR